jgi:Tol biopolymer transport system component
MWQEGASATLTITGRNEEISMTETMKRTRLRALLTMVFALLTLFAKAGVLHDAAEVHLTEVRQLTFQGENAEAYWAPNGRELILQATTPPYTCDQIFRLAFDHPGKLELVSTGTGRTTCAYFFPTGDRILYSSTHLASKECPPTPDHSQGYVWPIYSSFEIFTADLDGSNVHQITQNDVYDAEATLCSQDGSMVFTSTRDGDLELYRMDGDGSNVVRLTETPGYDGGAFFSPDCSKIVWRASRPAEGAALDEFRRLLGEGLVRPSKLELWVANSDGSEARQITYLDAASFAPYFHPSGQRILFSTNYGDPQGREFDIWAVDLNGSRLERITHTPGFDGFPMFSPNGEWLAFSSNRNQGKPGETDVYVARWVEGEAAFKQRAVDRFGADVRWLADDAREGRGVGTAGLDEAAHWLAQRFAELGVAPAAGDEGSLGGGYFQPFEVPMRVHSGPGTYLKVDGTSVDGEGFVVASFATSGTAAGEVVAVSYGISAPDLEWDDYSGLEVEGKIVVVRRFAPEGEPFAGEEGSAHRRRYGDLRYKAWNAREHGAVGVIIVDFPKMAAGVEMMPAESPLPGLRVETKADAGIPVMVLSREPGRPLFEGGHHLEMGVDISVEREPTNNVVGKIVAGAPAEQRLPGALVVGAHFDHLGFGGPGSLEPDVEAPHNGADDNASGTAALLEIARRLVPQQSKLQRDVYLVAFSGEERGLRGSTYFTKNPPPGLHLDDLTAMVNLDMIGRLRGNTVSALGGTSAVEWDSVLLPLCDELRLGCTLSGDGYGPSDQTPFYAAGVPVLHFFTGAHSDYHKPSDDTEHLNLVGATQIAALVSNLATTLVARPEAMTYQAVAAPESGGDQRSYGASLGTIPDYANDKPGVLLAGTRPGGPAEKAGMQRGDRLVELAEHEVRDIYDFMFVLRQSKPGETVAAVVERKGERVQLEVTFGQRARRLR